MIAYDFDGVICSDVNLPWNDPGEGLKALNQVRDTLFPIFRPTGEFYIITGRSEQEKIKTEEWCKKNHIYPRQILFRNTDASTPEDVALYKSKCLMNHSEITLYVESDPKQVEIIRQFTNIKVVHFSEFISQGLRLLL